MKVYEILREDVDQSLPPTIKPLKVPAFPEMPQQDGDLGQGQQAGPTKDGGKYLSGSEGKFIWDKQGQPSKWQAPSLTGTTQTVDMKTGDITVRLQQGGSDVSGVYDKTGKRKDGQGSASYDFGIAKAQSGPQGNTITVRGGAKDGSQDQTVAVNNSEFESIQEMTAGGTGAGSVAGAFAGGGNGFVNGGPGTIQRVTNKPKKKKKQSKNA